MYLPAQCRFCLFSLGQHDRKGRAFAGGAFYLQLCAGQFQNPLDQRHAKTIALGGVARVALVEFIVGQHRTIPALRLKHRSGSCGTASALPKCSIMSGCGTRIVLRGQKPLALCDRCPCFGSLFPPLAALTFAASSIICAFGLASAAPRSPYRHLELCGIALDFFFLQFFQFPHFLFPHSFRSYFAIPPFQIKTAAHRLPYFPGNGVLLFYCVIVFKATPHNSRLTA